MKFATMLVAAALVVTASVQQPAMAKHKQWNNNNFNNCGSNWDGRWNGGFGNRWDRRWASNGRCGSDWRGGSGWNNNWRASRFLGGHPRWGYNHPAHGAFHPVYGVTGKRGIVNTTLRSFF